jgi:hypothetical protein
MKRTLVTLTLTALALAGCASTDSEPAAEPAPIADTAAPTATTATGPTEATGAIATSGEWEDIDWDSDGTPTDGIDEAMDPYFAEMDCLVLIGGQYPDAHKPFSTDVQHTELHEGWYVTLGFASGARPDSPTYQFECLHRDRYNQLTLFDRVQ